MDRAPERSPYWLAAAIWLVLVGSLAVVNRAFYFEVPILESADAAVNGIMIENARHFTQLYGNYSRFEFNHPGPAFYYVYAAGEFVLHDLLGVTPSPGNAHLATCMALQSGFLALALGVFAARWQRRTWLPLACIAASIVFGPNPAAIVSIWPPDVLLMPFLAFLVACASVASGRIDHSIVMMVTGGFLFHGHVAQSMFVGSLGLLTLLMNFWHRRHSENERGLTLRAWLVSSRRYLLVAAGIAALFLLPLVIDVVLFGKTGNVATILARFRVNTDEKKSVLQALLYFLSFATTTHDQGTLLAEIGPATKALFVEQAPRLLAWGLVIVATPVALLIWRRHWSRPERTFLVSGLLLFLCSASLCLLWGMAQARDMFHFNGVFYYSVYFFAALLALALVARAMDRRYVRGLGIAVAATAMVVLAIQRHVPPPVGDADGMSVKNAVAAGLSRDPEPIPRFLVFEHPTWPTAAAVALELHRQAAGFRIAPWWGFMFGARHESEGPDRGPDRAQVWWITKPAPDGIPLVPELSLFTRPAPIQPERDEIRFAWADGVDGNCWRYVVAGISFGNLELAWTNLATASFRFATPKTAQDVRIVFDAKSAVADSSGVVPQPADVTFNGVPVGRVEVTNRAKVSVVVPAAEWNRQPEATLAVTFPKAIVDRIPGRPRYEGRTAWGLWSIGFEAVAR